MKKFLFLLFTFLILAILLFLFYRLFFLSSNAKGALQVTSVPESTVYVNGKDIGITPLCICGKDTPATPSHLAKLQDALGADAKENFLPVGEYTIRLVPKDSSFPEFQEKITIGQSVLTVVDRKFGEGATSEGSVITLEPVQNPTTSEILVLAVPDGASVLLDSDQIGTSPVHETDVTESDHELLLKKNGYTDKAVRIKTAKGYKLIAKIYLGVNQQAVTGRQEEEEASDSSEEKSQELSVSQVRILATGTGFLRVREGPSLGDAEIGRVTPQESYPLVSEEGEWYQIEFEEGKLGWVNKRYAEKIEE